MTLEAFAPHSEPNDLACREIAFHRPRKPDDMENTRCREECCAQCRPHSRIALLIEIPIAPANLDVLRKPKIAAFRPEPGRNVRASDNNARVPAVSDQVDRGRRAIFGWRFGDGLRRHAGGEEERREQERERQQHHPEAQFHGKLMKQSDS